MLDYNSIQWEDIVYYDETSPTFLRWRINIGCGTNFTRLIAVKDSVAGGIGKRDGYCLIGYNHKVYRCHRIVWILFNSILDNEIFIDHINGIRSDNHISNLRLADRTINARNASRLTSITGIKGVSYSSRDDVYIAHWYSLSGKMKAKYFYCKTHGKEIALELAIRHRQSMIEQLNTQGAGYSSRHLTNLELTL